MGMVYTEITLKNALDVGDRERGYMKEQEVRQTTVRAVVDTGALTLVINENLCQQLGLGLRGTRQATLANNKKETVKVAGPVEVHWKNRRMICEPWVISDSGKVFLGAIPLEHMDLIVDPANEVLVGRHGEEEVGYLY